LSPFLANSTNSFLRDITLASFHGIDVSLLWETSYQH
jgi:hypothetical protein